jgi:hypothetical protein
MSRVATADLRAFYVHHRDGTADFRAWQGPVAVAEWRAMRTAQTYHETCLLELTMSDDR